jgi:hypothetical protein
MPVLTMPGKSTAPRSLVLSAVSRSAVRVFESVRRPFNMPRWAMVFAIALLALGGFVIGRHRPAHHYVAYFGYPLVLDTTTGKACYAVPPPPKPAATDAATFPLDGTASQLDTQETAGDQIPLCGQQ